MNIIEKILEDNSQIETNRLIIYPFIYNNKVIRDLFEIYSNPNNVKSYCQPFFNLLDFATYMESKIDIHQQKFNGIISFLIKHKIDDCYIGVRNIILDGAYTKDNNRDDHNENLISEILIREKYWRNGYAEEATDEIFNFLRKYDAENFITFIEKDNSKAISLNKKLGFSLINKNVLLSDLNFHPDCFIHTSDINKSIIMFKKLK